MEFVPLPIHGAHGIIGETTSDLRGSLTRVWDKKLIFMDFDVAQSSFVLNPKSMTMRGLHFQIPPYSENKVVQCLSGKVFDVILDLREKSSTFKEHVTLELGPKEKFLGVTVPAGCAHGYLTVEDNSTLIYFMDNEYSPENSRGLFWNDPALSIKWPGVPLFISERDSKWPLLG